MPRAMTKETYAEHWSGGHATSSGRSVHVPDDVERVSEHTPCFRCGQARGCVHRRWTV